MSIVAQIECQLHDAEVLVGLALEGIEEVQLIHFGIEEMVLSLLHSEHKGRVRHININLLYNKSLRSFSLVFVRAFAVAFIFP